MQIPQTFSQHLRIIDENTFVNFSTVYVLNIAEFSFRIRLTNDIEKVFASFF
jgi:hypothetical protein